jgi:uncharacterized membrane protein
MPPNERHSDTQAVSSYLAEVELHLAHLAPSQRAQVIADLRSHIDSSDDAEIDDVLTRLGDPIQVANIFTSNSVTSSSADRLRVFRVLRFATVVALLLAAIATAILSLWFIVAWMAAVLALWMLPSWSTRDRVIATSIAPVSLLILTFLRVPRWISSVDCHSSATCFHTAPLAMLILGWVLLTILTLLSLWSVLRLLKPLRLLSLVND